jgi:hypothetical protein
MNYKLIRKVMLSGIAETGVTAIVNDRFHQLRVPWEISHTGQQNVKWVVESDDGNKYTVTVPVYAQNVEVTEEGQTFTQGRVTYQAGDYTVEKLIPQQEDN